MNNLGRLRRFVLALTLGLLESVAWCTPQGSVGMVPLTHAQFCELPTSLDEAGCHWKSITLSHRWEPQATGRRWALYRFTIPHPGAGLYALVGERISMSAHIRVPGQRLEVNFPHANQANSVMINRYWPQLMPFALKEEQGAVSLQLDVMVQGDRSTKNGIGSLGFGRLPVAQQAHWIELLKEVVFVLALASGTLIAGLIGLFAAERRTQAGQLLFLFSVLAAVAASRTAMGFVVHPPVALTFWTTLNLWMLCVIAVLTCTSIALYLNGSVHRCMRYAAGGTAILSLALVAAPVHRLYEVAEVLFALLALVGIALVVALSRRVWRTRDPLGALLLGGLVLIVVLGIHDLMIHLGASSLSDRYFQKWSTPVLIILTIALLARRVATQRSIESALVEETFRRDELMRDLHDGVGSRLVALAFHARTLSKSAALVDEIQGLIHELQMIQQAVRTGPTQLSSLLADLRHLYARVGGGQIPLSWDVKEGVDTLNLSARQAVATLRILEEAITNAMKHAKPERIIVRLERSDLKNAVVLSVIDDGPGQFQPGPHGGLHNMQHRANQAGIALDLALSVDCKAVRLTFSLEAEKAPVGFLHIAQHQWRRAVASKR
jgi:signal transduction histidine kinase